MDKEDISRTRKKIYRNTVFKIKTNEEINESMYTTKGDRQPAL